MRITTSFLFSDNSKENTFMTGIVTFPVSTTSKKFISEGFAFNK